MRDCMQFDNTIRRYAICGHAIYVLVMGDETISESHKCIDLAPLDGSSVIFLQPFSRPSTPVF